MTVLLFPWGLPRRVQYFLSREQVSGNAGAWQAGCDVKIMDLGSRTRMNQFVQEALQMLHRRGELESASSLRNLHLPISFFLSCIFIVLFTSNLITVIKAVFLSLRLSAEWSKVLSAPVTDRRPVLPPCDSWHRSFTPVMPN